MSIVIVISMTIDRFIAVQYPLKANIICTPKRAKITMLVALPIVMVYTSPYIFYTNYTAQKLALSKGGKFMQIYSWVVFCMNSVCPFMIIFIFNMLIIEALRQRYLHMNTKDARPMKGEEPAGQPGSSVDTQLVVMLLLVTFSLLVLTLPYYIRVAIYTLKAYRQDVGTYATYILAKHVTHKLYFTNSSINFILYCLGGSKFRQEA